MIDILSNNVTTPLGMTTAENLAAVRAGKSGIRRHHDSWLTDGCFMASLFSDDQMDALSTDESLTRFETLAMSSIRKALDGAHVDDAKHALLVISTTKGNISQLGKAAGKRTSPAESAQVIADRLGIVTTPIVVDNACVSGLQALVLASRMIENGAYRNAIVCGVEEQSRFIVAGFQSLKAMSPKQCRPFDIDRNGLNLGEAAATIILGCHDAESQRWHISDGCIRNDAWHISTPSPKGEGAYRALKNVASEVNTDDIAFVNAHGTATLFNDQMESVAIERAGLNDVPVNAYKANYGHTMGACGAVETALSMAAIDEGIILPTLNFAERGVSGKINVINKETTTQKRSFIKMLSGFGGVNVAASFNHNNADKVTKDNQKLQGYEQIREIKINPDSIAVDGKQLPMSSTGKAMITEAYKQKVGNYPRFYKMDLLCRIGFIAASLLTGNNDEFGLSNNDNCGIAFIGRTGSIVADKSYYASIADKADFYPSPERFVYTLPNIVTGEIATHYHLHGETGFYLLPEKDELTMNQIFQSMLRDETTEFIIGGWLNCDSDDDFEANIRLLKRK